LSLNEQENMLAVTKVLLSLIFLYISGCATSSEDQIIEAQKADSMSRIKQTWQKVTVKYLDFEGGFYGLVSQSGTRLLPMGLPKEYKIEGTV
jgi:hypothetical protein